MRPCIFQKREEQSKETEEFKSMETSPTREWLRRMETCSECLGSVGLSWGSSFNQLHHCQSDGGGGGGRAIDNSQPRRGSADAHVSRSASDPQPNERDQQTQEREKEGKKERGKDRKRERQKEKERRRTFPACAAT